MSLAVSNAPGGVTVGDPATGTITDDDGGGGDRAGGNVTVTIADASASEGDSLTFTVTLNQAVQGGLTVTPGLTDETATSGEDYRAGPPAVRFAGSAGETRTFTVSTVEDDVEEGDETFTVSLAVSGTTATATATDTATGRIVDDDLTPVVLTVDVPRVSETAGSMSVEVTAAFEGGTALSTATAVHVTVGGPGDAAIPGTDYTASPASFTVTIPAGKVLVEFEARGLESGTATLTAEAAEAGYDRLETRLVVRADATELSLEQLHFPERYGIAGSTLGEPLDYRVRDENLVPYSGVELAFTVTDADAAELQSSRTDAFGRAEIEWPLASSAGSQTLTATISGVPDSAVETQAVVSENPPAVMAALTANAASGETADGGRGFARGSLVTIYGNALGTEPSEADTILTFDNPALPVDLGLTSVHVAGVAVPLVKVSQTEITFQLPFQIPADAADIVVSSPFGRTDPVMIPLGPAQPGIFPDRVSGGARAAVVDPDNPGGVVLPRAGGLLEVHGTGFGAVSPPGRTGRPGLSMPRQNVVAETEAWVDEQPVEVTMSALASFEAGVYVVTLDLPADLEPGDHTVKIAVGGHESNSVAFVSE